MKRYKQKNLYSKSYPHHLPWHKALWIIKKGDIINVDNVKHKVTNVELSAIRGSLPKVTIEEYQEDN